MLKLYFRLRYMQKWNIFQFRKICSSWIKSQHFTLWRAFPKNKYTLLYVTHTSTRGHCVLKITHNSLLDGFLHFHEFLGCSYNPGLNSVLFPKFPLGCLSALRVKLENSSMNMSWHSISKLCSNGVITGYL